ncbi:MAG: hydroxymethylglutaryl-CoA reductase, degradative [Armatimonadota bacterium]|nr:hydroxymethylglutaryl-CoA reductase, degradative [Armatimonadota bacterium]
MARELPSSFRKLPAAERRALLAEWFAPELSAPDSDLDRADVLVENAFGWHRLPLGLVPNFPVNGRLYHVPLATEEPSVIAAAAFAGRILARGGGLEAEADPNVIRGQLFLEGADPERWPEAEPQLAAAAAEALQSMERRGGGYRGLGMERLPETQVTALTILADVCDAQGANALNTVLERLAPLAESLLGGRRLMAILSNNSPERLARARFRVGMEHLARAGLSGPEMARRLELASRVAHESVDRAVTHNKGILNGISALALATGNDTRALEAAVHAWASRSGRYLPLSRYRVVAGALEGEVELPLPLATVGGGTRTLPSTAAVWSLLGVENARELRAVAAALGLAQNFAALAALCAEGIQQGHMRLHQRRLGPEG